MNEQQTGSMLSLDSKTTLSNEDGIEWINSIPPGNINGVALVIHGLNLRPDRMESISAILAHSKIDVLNLSLRGHGENYTQKTNVDESKARMETFKTVSHEFWIKEAHRAYGLACKRSIEKQVPLFFIGFSLGGLIGTSLFASYPEVYFNRMVLLAPALHIYKIYYLAKLLSPFQKLVIPSCVIKSYCSNRGTPMAAYNALFKSIKHFNKHMSYKLNVPTLIFLDKKDELVSYQKLKCFIKDWKLHQWKLHPVKKSKTDAKEKMHHLIIDESSVGKNAWNEMRELIIHHIVV